MLLLERTHRRLLSLLQPLAWLLGIAAGLAGAPGSLTAVEPAAPTLFRRVELPVEVLASKTVEGQELICSGEVRLGDFNGDGQVELLVYRSVDAGVKPCFLAAVSLAGKLLWKLGREGEVPVRPGPVTPFDFDGDGQDEIACLCFDPRVKADVGSMANVRLQIRSGSTGELLKQVAPPELTSCKNEDPQWPEHYNWVQQRVLIANLRGGERPRDLVLKIGGRLLAFDDSLKLLWKFECPETERPYHPAFIPAVGDVNGDGRDEIFLGHALLDAQGKPLWGQRRSPNADSVVIGPWDKGLLRTFSSAAGEVLDASGKEITSVGRRMVPQGKEIRVADLVPDSPGAEMIIRNEGSRPGVIVANGEGEVLRRFKLNNSPGDMGLETILWSGPGETALIYNGGALWNGSGLLHAEFSELPPAVGPAAQGWYHCLAADVCGDQREEAVIYNPWDKFVWIFTPGEVQADAFQGYHPGVRQWNPRITD